MKKIILRIALLALALTLALSQTAMAEPPENLKPIYDALMAEDSLFNDAAALFAEYGEDAVLAAALEENGITITLSHEGEVYSVWPFVLDGDRMTAVLAPDDADGEDMAYLLLMASVAAQGVDPVLFDGYVSAHPELEAQYRIVEQSETEQRISVDVAGPYEYDMEELNGLVMSEEVLRNWGLAALNEYPIGGTLIYGKVSIEFAGAVEGVELVVKEYGGLDEVALQDILCAVRVLQPRGWEEFIASCTALTDAETDAYTAFVNLTGDALAAVDSHPAEGYSYAFIAIGSVSGEE